MVHAKKDITNKDAVSMRFCVENTFDLVPFCAYCWIKDLPIEKFKYGKGTES